MEDEASASGAASEASEVGVRMSFGPVLAEEGSNLDRWEPEEQRAGMQQRQVKKAKKLFSRNSM